MAEIELRLKFDSVDDLLDLLGAQRKIEIAEQVLLVTGDSAPCADLPDVDTVLASPSMPVAGSDLQKRTAYLKFPDGRVTATRSKSEIASAKEAGAVHINLAEYEATKEYNNPVPEPEQKSNPEPAADPSPQPSPAGTTFDDVREAVRRLNSGCSLNAVFELLAEFNVGKVSELREDQYAAFVARTQEVSGVCD